MTQESPITIHQAISPEDIDSASTLLREYAEGLGVDLSFQDFDQELVTLPGDYAAPSGTLLLARYNGALAGCVALRRFETGICEMKRLYVKPLFRGLGVGKALSEAIIASGRSLGYHRMRLDTLSTMQGARMLYTSLGFKEIAPYRFNPVEGAVFMELLL